jgi:hypothetical protein
MDKLIVLSQYILFGSTQTHMMLILQQREYTMH